MECKNCKDLKKLRNRYGSRQECWCSHEKVKKMPGKMFDNRAPGFICYTDEKGEPKIKTHPRWCPLPSGNVKKGQYVAEWDEKKGKIALKFKEDSNGAGTGGNQSD